MVAVQESNSNIRFPQIMEPGQYPYTRFEQYRDGSWNRQDETPNNESQATGHRTGSVEEVDNSGGHKRLKVGQSWDYRKYGHADTIDLNHHQKIGGSTVHQITTDRHEEHGQNKSIGVGGDFVHASKGFQYHHATGGLSHSSVGDHTTDHNDGNEHTNIQGDKVTFIGGVKYENVNSDYGILVSGNYDLLVNANAQITSAIMYLNASNTAVMVNAITNVTFTAPNVYSNCTWVFMNNISGNTTLCVGNAATNTLINSTSVTSPAYYIGDPVAFANVTTLNIGQLAVSSNGSNGLSGQVLYSNSDGTYWAFPTQEPAGNDMQIQFNNSNETFACSGLIFNYNTNTLIVSNSFSTLSILANGSQGNIGQVLVSGGSSNIYWANSSGGGNSVPSGNNMDIQFNDSGNSNGSDGFIFNKVTNSVTISNTLILGNSTVNSNINSISFSGTSNNTLFVGSTSAVNVVSNAQLQSNLSNYVNTTQLSSNLSLYTNTALLLSNISSSSTTTYSNAIAQANIYANNAYNNSVSYVTSLSLVNTSQLTSNLANYVNTSQLTSNLLFYVNTSQLTSNLNNYQTTAGLSSNVATLISNNTLFVGSVSAVNVVSNAQLQANLAGLVTNSQFSANLSNYVNTSQLTSNLNNYVNTSQLSSNLSNYVNTSQLTSNLTNYVNTSQLTSNLAAYQLNSTLNANIANYLPNYTGIVNGSSAAFSGNVGVGGNFTVTGNLILSGATTFVNSTVITTNDLNIILANNASTNTLANNSGIIIGTSANLIYNSSFPAFQSNVAFIPSSNNLNLGETTNLWNIYGNNISGTLTTSSQPNITANNTNFVGSTSAANVVSNTQLQSNLANYVNNSQLTSNLSNYVNTTQLSSNLTNYVNTSQLTSNLSNYQTTAGLSSNVATLTSNNSTNFAGHPSSYYANVSSASIANIILTGNVQLTGANVGFLGSNTTNYVNPTNMVTPEMYGAVGNGTANDTLAVNTAFNSGKTVFLQNQYNCGGQIIVPLTGNNSLNVTGISSATSRLIFSSSVSCINISIANTPSPTGPTWQKVNLKDFAICYTLQSSVSAVYIAGEPSVNTSVGSGSSISTFNIQNIDIIPNSSTGNNGPQIGFEFYNCRNSSMKNCLVQGQYFQFYGSGVKWWGGANGAPVDFHMDNCILLHFKNGVTLANNSAGATSGANDWQGVYINASTIIAVNNGIYATTADTFGAWLSVTGCNIGYNNYGIYMPNIQSPLIVGNYIQLYNYGTLPANPAAIYAPLNIGASMYGVISSNIFQNTDVSFANSYAIYAPNNTGANPNGPNFTIVGNQNSYNGYGDVYVPTTSMTELVGYFGSNSSSYNTITAYSNSAVGVIGQSNTFYGVYGQSCSSVGVFGVSTSSYGTYGTSNSNYGAYGISNSSAGVIGYSNTSHGGQFNSNTGNGVFANSNYGYGVYAQSGNSGGVYGLSNTNTGVSGFSTSGYGVYGQTNSSYGVYGVSNTSDGGHFVSTTGSGAAALSSSGYGIYAGSTSGPALYAQSITNYGIEGVSNTGIAIYGISNTNSGGYFLASQGAAGVQGFSNTGYGGYFQSNTNVGVYASAPSYIGVFGSSTSGYGGQFVSNSNYGVYGVSNSGYAVIGISTSGVGVQGYSSTNIAVSGGSTTNLGVYGQSNSYYGGYFISNTNIGVLGQSTTGVAVYGIAGTTVAGQFVTNNGIGIVVQSNTNSILAQFNASSTVIAQINSTGHFNTVSDINIKDGVKDSSLGLKELDQIKVRDFYYKSDSEKKINHGFIAQELYEVYPYAVHKPDEKTEPDETEKLWMVDYSQLTPLVVKSIQDLFQESKILKEESKNLREEIKILREELEFIKNLRG